MIPFLTASILKKNFIRKLGKFENNIDITDNTMLSEETWSYVQASEKTKHETSSEQVCYRMNSSITLMIPASRNFDILFQTGFLLFFCLLPDFSS